MKRLLCLSLVALSMSGFGQSSYILRPDLGNMGVTDGSGKQMAASAVSIGQVIKLMLPIYNNSFKEVVMAGSGSLEIDLGAEGASTLELVDQPVSNDFSWGKPFSRDGHIYVLGRLVSNLAPRSDVVETLVLRSSGPLNTRLRAHWLNTIPSSGRSYDLFTELQIQVGSRK